MQDTSLTAYRNEVQPTLGARQISVLRVFEENPGRDFTNSELEIALRWKINQITGRVKELRDIGILELSRKRSCGETKRIVQAWRLKDKPVVLPRAIAHAPTHYQLPSVSQRGERHTLRVSEAKVSCGCKGFHFRGTCSHITKLMRREPKPEEMMNSLFAV